MQLYDIFDPNGYNNVFAFSYPLEPVLVVPPGKRTVKGRLQMVMQLPQTCNRRYILATSNC
ncbi:hypothetical protein BS47DRAFT_1352276, partial [Hydnum rufescens UP504]